MTHGVEMLDELDELGEQAHAKTSGTATCLVPDLVLIEPQVRIARCLANVQPPSPMSPHIVKQNDVHGMPGVRVSDGSRPQRRAARTAFGIHSGSSMAPKRTSSVLGR